MFYQLVLALGMTFAFALAPSSVAVAAEGVSPPRLEKKDAIELPPIKVYKRASCGCCNKWIEHLKSHGFKVSATDMKSLRQLKQSIGISPALASCHTGLIGDYVIEGHVPAQDIKRLLQEKPAIKGLSVPGMPLGSPGMEQPDGTKEAYEVLSFDEAGKTGVWSKY